MAAPTHSATFSASTDAGGAWSLTTGTTEDTIIIQILQDGTTGGAVAVTTVDADLFDLAGNSGALTHIGSFAVGSPTAALQHLWIARHIGGASSISGTNSTSEDLYMQVHSFNDVSAGTTLATVIENVTAGATVNSVGTSATASDASVTTLGVDRLAVNFVAVNDDNPIAQFSGQTGGTWVEVAEYAAASGTDGAIQLQYAAMASAGTIDGGTASITDSDAWGVVGFALIGTTPDSPSYAGLVTPRVMSDAVHRASNWCRRHDGLLVPRRRLWVA